MQVGFYVGTLEDLNKRPITPGNLYVLTDTQQIYFDASENNRICLGQMEALSIEELNEILV